MGSGKSPGALWKAAGPLAGFGKAQQKPWGTLEGSRALCGHQQSLDKAVGHCRRQQSPLRALERPGKSPGALWKAAEPFAGVSKAPRQCGEKWGTLRASAKPSKSPEELQSAGPLWALSKAWHKPWGLLEGSRASCGLQQSAAKAPRHCGRQQGPLWALSRSGKSPGALWKAAWPVGGFGKARIEPRGILRCIAEPARAASGGKVRRELAMAAGRGKAA